MDYTGIDGGAPNWSGMLFAVIVFGSIFAAVWANEVVRAWRLRREA
jgi:hypothetical protein